MTYRTILENLFRRVMKNGKRISDTRALVFGTRIFCDDFLLPDDIIICTDWTDYISMRIRKEYKHVEFLSENAVKKLVSGEKLYNYIERKYDVKKFDIVVSNPPYDGDLHLQILDTMLNLGKTCVFVHPARWVEDVLAQFKSKSATGRKYGHLKTALEKVYLIKQIDGNNMFNIGLRQDMMIGVYSNSDANPALPIYDNSERFFDILKKILNYAHNVCSTEKMSERSKLNGIRVALKDIVPVKVGSNSEWYRNQDTFVVDNMVIDNGYVGEKFWAFAKSNQGKFKKSNGTPIPISIEFRTKDLAQTFIDLYRTNVVKNIIYMLKYDQNAGHTHIPYFDPKTIKTDDDVLDALGITEPEYRTWLKRDVYDYREKDFIRYNEWIDC